MRMSRRMGLLERGVLYDPVFSNNDWAAIITACQSGSVPDTWAVGDSKDMTINGTSYAIDIIGKDHDSYSDGSGTAPLTFQLHDCYKTNYKMNTSNTNVGGWTSSAMRSTHLPAIRNAMPAEVIRALKKVNKLTSEGNKSTTIDITKDDLFLLSEVEIFGSTTYSVAGEGTQYEYYAVGNSKVKNYNGSASNWWERSPRASNTAYFCFVGSGGNANNRGAGYSCGVAFAFCF